MAGEQPSIRKVDTLALDDTMISHREENVVPASFTAWCNRCMQFVTATATEDDGCECDFCGHAWGGTGRAEKAQETISPLLAVSCLTRREVPPDRAVLPREGHPAGYAAAGTACLCI